jgi:hypothetical protein
LAALQPAAGCGGSSDAPAVHAVRRPSRSGGAADWVVFRSIDPEFKPPALTIVYRRIFFRGDWDILDVWFCYRVDARRAEEPEVLDLIALFDREVRQAVIDFPETGAGPAGAPG